MCYDELQNKLTDNSSLITFFIVLFLVVGILCCGFCVEIVSSMSAIFAIGMVIIVAILTCIQSMIACRHGQEETAT